MNTLLKAILKFCTTNQLLVRKDTIIEQQCWSLWNQTLSYSKNIKPRKWIRM